VNALNREVSSDGTWLLEALRVFASAGTRYIYLKNLERYLKISFGEAIQLADRLVQLGYLQSMPEKFGPVFCLSEVGRQFARENGIPVREIDEPSARDYEQNLLKEKLQAAEVRADQDAMLSLYNRGRFDRDLDEALSCATASGLPCALVLLDLDHFKSVNDTHGHPVGDEVLQAAAQLLRQVVGERGRCYRYGGEELVILLPNFALGEALALAERLRAELERQTISSAHLQVTASFGVAEFPSHAGTPKELLGQADAAVYLAKSEGRNRVRACALPLPRATPSP